MTSIIEKFEKFEIKEEIKEFINEEDNDLCDICMVRPINTKIKCDRCEKCICSLCLNQMKELKINIEQMNIGLGITALYTCPFCRKEDVSFYYNELNKKELNLFINTDYNNLFKIGREGRKYEELYEELLMKQMKMENIIQLNDDELTKYLIEENINKGEMFNEMYEKNEINEAKIRELNNSFNSLVVKHKEIFISNKALIEENKRLLEYNNKIVEENKRIVEINKILSLQTEEILKNDNSNIDFIIKLNNCLNLKDKPHLTIRNLKNMFKGKNIFKYNATFITTEHKLEYI